MEVYEVKIKGTRPLLMYAPVGLEDGLGEDEL